MAKLYFRYGTMGSSKSAQALMVEFNYRERGYHVLLAKPAIDTRDQAAVIRSRVGLERPCRLIYKNQRFADLLEPQHQVIIVDEAQFLTGAQVEELKNLTVDCDMPVLCYGLRTDFSTHMFEGSARLLELAESVVEIKSICHCGAKATVNARFNENGIIREGPQVVIGGNEQYTPLCYRCWREGRLK